MSDGTVYSERLGAIRDEQFAAACTRLNVGTFVKAEPTTAGLFGQNVFVTTSVGEFVLRGAPHWIKGPDDEAHRPEDRWQFSKETFFAQRLHEATKAPVPWPFLHETTSDIFGWPFILMQRTPGFCFNERDILKTLEPEDRRGVASAMGAMLAEMQRLASPFAGDFGHLTIALEPYPDGNTRQVISETLANVRTADAGGAITDADRTWIDDAAARALAAGERPNTYVHCDYKLNNLTVLHDKGGWRVSGLFDLHEARFGDGALDIVRQACSYLDSEPALARVFVDAWRERVTDDRRIRDLMPLYILNDRMKFWGFFTRPGSRAKWSDGKTFRGWAERYVDGVMRLL